MTEPIPNLPLLRKVLDHIDAHPDEWLQHQWITATECGTACCIAGHAVSMLGYQPEWWAGSAGEEGDISARVYPPGGGVPVSVSLTAIRELGLTEDEGERLFHSDNTRGQIQQAAEAIAARAGERL